MSLEIRKKTYRDRLLQLLLLGAIPISLHVVGILGYTTDTNIYAPPNYLTFQPPAVGGSYIDPVFGSPIKRITNAMNMKRADNGGAMPFVSPEYSTMSPFNQDETRLLLIHFSYFGLYDGDGNFLRELPSIDASAEPRWSRSDPNVFYYRNGNQLRSYNVGTAASTTVHRFSEYSSISGMGESDISLDGNHLVLAGNKRYIFLYEISTDSKGAVLDANTHSFDSLYVTPNNNVTVTWLTNGNGTRFTGIELFDRNMNFQRQLAHAGGHMDVTTDLNGDEVLLWVASGDPQPLTNCKAGVVKIRLADARQTCIWAADWSMGVHVSATDNSGWVFVENFVPSDPVPPTGWLAFTDEIIQVKLDGSEVRRLVHHRSRPFNSYEYQPKTSASRDGSKLVFGSNFGLQKILGYPSLYGDAYLIDVGSTNIGTTDPAVAPTPPPPSSTTSTPTISTPTTSTPTRIEQNGSSVTYSGTWYTKTMAANSGGSSVMALDTGARANIAFNGTDVTWIGYRDAWSGIAKVYVDNILKATVDTYALLDVAQAKLYSVTGLPPGSHTLSIEVTGTRSASSQGSWIWIDAFDLTSGGTTSVTSTSSPVSAPTSDRYRVEETSSAVQWSGQWYENRNGSTRGGSAKLSQTAGSRATFTFTGTDVTWIAYKDRWSGIARVYIDGVPKASVDTYAPNATTLAQAVAYTTSGLPWGTHTIVIEVSGIKRSSAKSSWVWVDSFEYVGAGQ